MPQPSNRESLTKDLLTRYATQHAGGAYEVKDRLKKPKVSVEHADRMPIDGIQEKTWTVPNFDTKPILKQTEMLDAIDETSSRELSTYIKGFSNKKYKS